MLILRGAPALSSFRHTKLFSRLVKAVPTITGLYAEYSHFADLSSPLSGNRLDILKRLLKYGPAAEVHEPAGRLFLVVPRIGTISPWSSKATDLARRCGLSEVQRLERGVSYYVEGIPTEA